MKYVNEGLPAWIEVDTQHQGELLRSIGNTLDEVYGRHSSAKAAAYVGCMELCDEMDGCNLCITSANTFVFSAQFEFVNPVNGRPMVCHITPSRTYAMYTDMRHISEAHKIWRHYAHDTVYKSVLGWNDADYDGCGTVYISVLGWNDADYDGCGIRWLRGTAYVYVDDEEYRVDNPLTKDGRLRVRPTLSKAGA